MNLPNKLTVSRLALTGAFLGVLFSKCPYHESISLILFSAASLTDYFDGEIARKRNLITNFGKLMDPLADKILTCSAFIAFVERGWMPAWMVVIIVARELAITGLRLLAASKNVVLSAERYGKHKTISQIVSIIAMLVAAGYHEWGNLGENVFGLNLFGQGPWVIWFATFSKWVTVALTAYSGVVYLLRNRKIYMEDI